MLNQDISTILPMLPSLLDQRTWRLYHTQSQQTKMVEPCKLLPSELLRIYALVTIQDADLHQFSHKTLQVLKRRSGAKQLRQHPYHYLLKFLGRGIKNVTSASSWRLLSASSWLHGSIVDKSILIVFAATFSNDVLIMVVLPISRWVMLSANILNSSVLLLSCLITSWNFLQIGVVSLQIFECLFLCFPLFVLWYYQICKYQTQNQVTLHFAKFDELFS